VTILGLVKALLWQVAPTEKALAATGDNAPSDAVSHFQRLAGSIQNPVSRSKRSNAAKHFMPQDHWQSHRPLSV
jgi:hypothetical protein